MPENHEALPRQSATERHLALVIEMPCMYTADIDELRQYAGEFDSESDHILNCIGDPGIVRVRMEISGEKDSDVVEVWGYVREAQLIEPGRGYETKEPHVTDAQLAEHGGFKLMRDEHACEWCQYREPEVAPDA
jgi:hypothetical protein